MRLSPALDAVLIMPKGSIQIVRDTGSIETAATWGEITGSRLNDVAEMEIHELRSPETFNRKHLEPLLALNDNRLVAKVLLLTNNQIDQLIDLPTTVFRDLAIAFSTEQLVSLS